MTIPASAHKGATKADPRVSNAYNAAIRNSAICKLAALLQSQRDGIASRPSTVEFSLVDRTYFDSENPVLLQSIASLAQSLEGGTLHTLILDGVPPAMCCFFLERHFPALAQFTLKAYSIDRKVQSKLDEDGTRALICFLRKHASTLSTFVTCNTFASLSPFLREDPFALPKLREVVFCDFALPLYEDPHPTLFDYFASLMKSAGLQVLDFSGWQPGHAKSTQRDCIMQHAGTLRIVGLLYYNTIVFGHILPTLPHLFEVRLTFRRGFTLDELLSPVTSAHQITRLQLRCFGGLRRDMLDWLLPDSARWSHLRSLEILHPSHTAPGRHLLEQADRLRLRRSELDVKFTELIQ